MRKFIAFFLACMIIFVQVGCSGDDGYDTDTPVVPDIVVGEIETKPVEPTPEPPPAPVPEETVGEAITAPPKEPPKIVAPPVKKPPVTPVQPPKEEQTPAETPAEPPVEPPVEPPAETPTETPDIPQNEVTISDEDFAIGELPPQFHDAVEDEIFVRINKLRVSLGVHKLLRSDVLDQSADIRSKEMVVNNYFEHRRADGSEWSTAIDEITTDKKSCAENIAFLENYAVKAYAQEMVNGWINSDPHYLAMTSPEYYYCGISVCSNNLKAYGTLHLSE